MARLTRVVAAACFLLIIVGLIPLFAQSGATAPTGPAPTARAAVPTTAPAAPANGDTTTPAATTEAPTPAAPEVAPSQPEPAKPRLSVFGQDFFRAAGINFEPNPEAPVPPDYVLGSGDSLSVICWYGNTEYERATVLVNGAGEIYLKTLGVVPASSRTAAQMTDELRRRYAKLYKQFELSVRVVGRRTIPVWVMGEVTKPGKFMLSSMATVFTALYAAGGPSDLGSLRAIRLMRHGKQVGADIDVYQYLLNGIDVSVPLEPGDTLFVPFTRTLVALDGEVRRPAIYELRETDITLSAALALAGGATPNSADLVSIVRVNADRERQTIDCTLPKDAAFVLRTGGANLRYSEFKVAYAMSVGGVRHIALIGHNHCNMVNLNSRRDIFVKGLVKNAGWKKKEAESFFADHAATFEIGSETDFILSEVKRLRLRYPKVTVAPLFYKIEDNHLYFLKEK